LSFETVKKTKPSLFCVDLGKKGKDRNDEMLGAKDLSPLRLVAPDVVNQFFRLFSNVAVVQDPEGTENDGDRQEKQQFHSLYS